MGIFLPCSSLALPLCFVDLVSCYGSVQEVSEPSLESPRPPMAVSRQGRRETSRFRLPSLHPCLLTAIPVRPPGGSPVACSSLAIPLFFVGLVSCYGSVQEVSEPSLESPRPPEWWQGQGNGEASRTSLASPFPCPCHHSPVRPPGGSPVAYSFLARQLFAA